MNSQNCGFRWKKDLENSKYELNLISMGGRRTINCNGGSIIKIDVDTFITINLKDLNLNSLRMDTGSSPSNPKINLLNCKASRISMESNLCQYSITDSEIVDSFIGVNYFTLKNTKLKFVNYVANGQSSETKLSFTLMEAIGCKFSQTSKGVFLIDRSTIRDSELISHVSDEISFEKSTFSNFTGTISFFSKLSISKSDLIDSPNPFYLSAGVLFSLSSSNVLNSWGFNTYLVTNINVRKSLFQANKGTIFMKQVTGIVIYDSQFLDNTEGALTIINEDIWKMRLFTISLSKFINNTSPGDGGALFLDTLLTVEASLSVIGTTTFENNKAINGGAIYSTISNLRLQSVTFTNNRAMLNCNNLNCGRGGAWYSSGSELVLEDSIFNGNTALKGGALYISNIHRVTGNAFTNNTALMCGNDVYFTSKNIRHLESVSMFRIASKPLNSISIFSNEQLVASPINIYPGEYISMRITLKDLMNNNVLNVMEEPTLTVNDSNIVVTAFFNSEDYLDIPSISVFVRDEEILNQSFNLTIRMEEFDAEKSIEMKIAECPRGYKLMKQHFGGFICENQYLTPIIVSSVLGAILIMCFFMGGMIFVWQVSKRLWRLYKKERAEKKLEKKLLDKHFVFSDNSKHEELNETLLSEHDNRKKSIIKENSFIIPVEDISLERRIGEGSNGVVYLATWSGFKVAVKSLKIESSLLDTDEEFEHEASLLANLRHPSIVNFFGIALGHTKYMIVEYLPNGSLDSVIAASRIGRKTLKMDQKLYILIGISKGMNYLHSLRPMSIIHRDLKPGNILLHENYQPKVTDFGLSRLTSQQGSSTMTTNLGTMLYMAPELLNSEYDITFKLDVFSFSIIMYELFLEEPPYLSDNKEKIMTKQSLEMNRKMNAYSIPLMVSKGLRPPIPFETSEEILNWNRTYLKSRESKWNDQIYAELVERYMELMKQAWAQDPSTRPTFSEITEHLTSIRNLLQDLNM